MNKTVRAKSVSGSLFMPSSKSLLHRYLIMASRSNVDIYYKGMSQDVKVTLEALKALGSDISYSDQVIKIRGYKKNQKATIDFNESGSSYRFLLSYAFIDGGDYEFTGSKRLSDRPIKDLLDELKRNGIEFSNDKLPIKGSGKLKGACFYLSSDLSSQYISGLMMALSFLKQKSTIKITSEIKSFSYIKMTAKVMEEFGVKVKISKQEIEIDPTDFKAPSKIYVEGDWSNALVAIGLALVDGDLEIENLSQKSYQGDSRLVEILQNHKCNIFWSQDKLMVKKSKLLAFDLDMEENIDLFPVMSVLALKAEGKSVFSNISRLRIKESDRIEAVLDMHKKLGAKSYLNGENFIVDPEFQKNKNVKISSFNDHRLVMAASLASLVVGEEIEIEGFEAINKSYPSFEEDLKSIGLNFGDR